MKRIEVKISAYYGWGHCGSYGSSETCEMEVSDDVASTIQTLFDNNKEVNQDVILDAIENGHEELKPFYDAIKEKHDDMKVRRFLFETDDCTDDSLEPAFWEDIESGLYFPESSIDECVSQHKNDGRYKDWDLEQEECRRWLYYRECREAYYNWVISNNDYDFIAKRVGVDLGAVYEDMSETEFVILAITRSDNTSLKAPGYIDDEAPRTPDN